MAIENSRFKTRKEREEEEKKRKASEERFVLPTYEELNAIEEKAKEDAARVASSEKGLDFFQRPSNWDDGYQFGDVTKTALGTLGDVGVNAVKGVVRMGEGIGDAAQYGAAALADLFGADEKAEAIRQNAQRDKVTEAFSGVDEKLNKYSVLGRTSDAAAESLGQIGAVIGTAGLAGALGAGALGTTAATTGLMGLSSFGSGTGEAYAAGAEEGEAEAYGAIAGAADALSEMIFGGLGKGFKALGLSKGITSADDVLAKAVTSKIRNTLAKNTVQLGIKAGAEGLEEVLAGTMQGAGKKMTYMSESDFADIIKGENLLEQFVVGAMASGISQTPSFVSATRAGVDLVSDGTDTASDSAPDEQDKFSELRGKNADFGEIERTGLASGAKDEDIRMAGELSSALGKKIRFFREDAKNGTINNGEYHEDTGEIWINTRSKNVKAQIVAHELTHSIEKKDSYQQLVDLTMNKLEEEQKAKGKTLDDLYREKETLYADGGVRLASYDEITSELVAEFVEKRLLTDEASIKSLVSENRTLGERIREWFDSLLVKMGNASAKEREYIRQMRDMYAKALGEDVGAGADGIQHHISKTEKGQPFVTIDRDILAGVPQSDWQQTVVDNLTGKYPNGIKIGNQQIQITEQGIDEIAYSKQAQWLYKNDINTLTDKYRASDNADEIVRSAQGWINEGLNHKRKDDIVDFARGKTLIRVGKNDYEADVLVARLKNDDLMLYDIYNLSPTTIKEKETGTVMNSNPSPSGIRNPANISSGNSISQNAGNVKGENAGNGQHSISAVDDEAVRKNTPGVKDAEETAQINEEIERVDLNYDSESGTVYHSFSSIEDAFDYNKGEEEYRAARNEYAYALAKATGKTYAQAQQYLDDLFLIHDLIGDDRDRLDYVAAVDRSSWVGNVEYGGSIDFSTLCAKRRLFTGTFDAIQQALPDTVLNENDFLRIRELLVEKGLESPCSMCYVEGSRAKHGVYVERFLRDYLETDPEWRPQIADFTSTTRLEQTRIQHPEAYKAYTDAMNKLSQRKPKEASVRTDYKGEILRAFKNDGNVNAKNLMGGIRFNSFSDFEIIHAIDVMQVLTDMARVGLHGQSYTKQKEFAEAFGNTGLKINLSLVAKDVDADGRLIFDEVNGMKEAEAMDIRDRYSENVGTVIVVFNEAQLRAALADERIDFVLPFHRSQWKKSQYTMMGLPAETRDFTNIQNDRMKNPKTGRAKKVEGGNIMPNQYWDPSLDGRGNAQLYLDYINENDYIPKFDFLLTKQDGKWVLPEGAVGDGYFKLLIDFKMYDNDGNGAPQRPVTPDFNMPYITKMLEDYKGGHGSFPVANDIVDTFVREKKGGRVKNSVSRVDDQHYKDAVDRGDMETAQKMVNEAAEAKGWIPVTRYHQTGAEFTKFSNENPDAGLNDSDTPNGFFFKENDHDIGVGGDYVKTGHGGNIQMPVFLKMENVLSFKNRDDARSWYTKNVPGYKELLEKYEEYQAEYKRLDNENTGKMFEELEKLDESGEYTASKADAIMKKYDAVIDDWIEKTKDYETGLRSEMRKLLNDFFLNGNSEYDAIELEDDGHRYIDGKREDVHTYIVFKNTQIKSSKPVTYDDNGNVIPLSERFKRKNDDIRHSVSREDASVTEAETDQTLQQIRNDIAADEARYRELSDIVMSNERFNAMTPDEQNAILDEMQNLRTRIDNANRIVQDMSYEQDAGDDVPMPTDEDAPPERRRVQAEYGEPENVDVSGEGEPKLTRKILHKNIMDGIKENFSARGLDLDKVLSRAKNLSTFATVDNTPQRVMEKALGYKEGNVLADLTVNQTAKNETEGIRWLNQFTDQKDGVLAQLSKKYNIKPGSKESAAAQMYAEGFYVDKHNEIVEYGDRELAADFPDAQVQKNIKGLANDPIIRQIYDQTLDAINESRVRNAYPEIQKLDNYYLHFRAMDDTFSKLGIPFNPNDIRAKDLPTDINGVTADLKPGQPYFASAQHRQGKRTSFDLLGGLEKYLTSAKNQIYHIDDIQTLRALRNYIADMYGQAHGLEGLDSLDEDAAQERIKEVYDAHLSTFAKFLNEEANIIAGKTSLIDRGLEGMIGRRGITFLNDINRQVGANMVGWNISSSLTNFLAPVQALAKTNKLAFIKGFAQTVENRLKSITGNGDDFAQNSDVIVRRKGADRFHRTAWQKMSDPGYLLMGMVDDISTEIIARAKYNELTAKGMDAETANRETDKWVSRLMGDRSLGQMPQIFNSKMLGLITKFQLEVRNQLDSQFYDTIKEAQADYEEIGDKTKRNAKVAAKVTATIAELALAQHVFGQVFESIAGYNPAFDIIEVIATVLGLDDDEESEDTVLDNIEQGVLALIEDMPYSSVIMDGGRIPISSALPISEIVTGEDQYGNEVNRLKTAAEAVPYYVLPSGYGQVKKTAQGLAMFGGDKPVTGSYTESGNLRFPVEATPGNIAQAAVFGQWASDNANDYFDNERSPISERQALGYAESGLEWRDYQKYKAQITKLQKDADKVSAIKELDIKEDAKEALYRSLVASAVKDENGNIIGSSEDDRISALYGAGLGFEDFLDIKAEQSALNADKALSAGQRATRFYAWTARMGYTDEQRDVITDQFTFSSGFKVQPQTYEKLVAAGVTGDNAVKVTDALTGTSRTIDKINAIWSTGLTGAQLDSAVKAVVTEKWYDRYRAVIDANVPLDVLTWVLDNADTDDNDSISNEERTLILSQLAMSRKELSALWIASGGSAKSDPWGTGSGNAAGGIKMPVVKMPEIKMPKIDFSVPHFGFEIGG